MAIARAPQLMKRLMTRAWNRHALDALDEFAEEGASRWSTRWVSWVALLAAVGLVAVFVGMRVPRWQPGAVNVPASSGDVSAPDVSLVLTTAGASEPQAERLTSSRLVASPVSEPAARPSLDTRTAIAQVASTTLDSPTAIVDDLAAAEEAPPRRIAPATGLSVTTLGGRGAGGQLSLELYVSADGVVTDASVVDAEGLDEAVVQSVLRTVSQWRYAPARQGGLPVPARVRVTVDLKGESD